MEPKISRVVFLDRDGTINVDGKYVYRPEDLQLTEGAVQGIRELKAQGFLIIVVTNQSGVARGLFTESDVHRFHKHLQQVLSDQGAFIDAFYFCPHHPEAAVKKYRLDCNCRKPKPGMLLRAIKDFNLDPKRCFMVGDQARDIEAGLQAGCYRCFLISSEKPTLNHQSSNKIRWVQSWLDAAQQILREDAEN